MKTYQLELGFVSAILLSVWYFNEPNMQEFIGTLAVIFTFCYVQVATRLDEKSTKESLPCSHWLTKYLFIKETLWLIYFIVFLKAWSAAIGVCLFLLYPFWRKSYHVGKIIKDKLF